MIYARSFAVPDNANNSIRIDGRDIVFVRVREEKKMPVAMKVNRVQLHVRDGVESVDYVDGKGVHDVSGDLQGGRDVHVVFFANLELVVGCFVRAIKLHRSASRRLEKHLVLFAAGGDRRENQILLLAKLILRVANHLQSN
jgi:hypothetical protein